jgi:hypothetical protein
MSTPHLALYLERNARFAALPDQVPGEPVAADRAGALPGHHIPEEAATHHLPDTSARCSTRSSTN